MLGRKMIEISQLFTEMGVKTKMHINFDKIAVNSTVYACADALNTMGNFAIRPDAEREKCFHSTTRSLSDRP